MAIRLKVQDKTVRLKVSDPSAVSIHATEGIGVQPPTYEGETTVTPTEATQTLETNGMMMPADVTVNPIPSQYIVPSGTVNIGTNGTHDVRQYASAEVNVTPPTGSATTPDTTITANPTISVNGSGLITATAAAAQDVTPTVVEGYVDRGTAGRITVSGSNTSQLDTLAAATYTPTKGSSIVIPSGKFLTGDQTVNPIPEAYYDMSGEWAFLGKDATIVKTDFYSKVDYLKNTSWHGWTPSTTAQTCVASVNCNTFTATNVADYDYYIVWECGVDPVYTGTPTNKALPQLARAWFLQAIERRPSTWANIQASNFNNTVSVNTYNSSFLRYYGTTTGTSTMTWGASYGFYFANTAAGISSETAASPTITPKTPTLSARCSTTYMSTTNAGLIDEDNTKWWIKGKYVIRCKKTSFYQGFYNKTVALINAASPTS